MGQWRSIAAVGWASGGRIRSPLVLERKSECKQNFDVTYFPDPGCQGLETWMPECFGCQMASLCRDGRVGNRSPQCYAIAPSQNSNSSTGKLYRLTLEERWNGGARKKSVVHWPKLIVVELDLRCSTKIVLNASVGCLRISFTRAHPALCCFGLPHFVMVWRKRAAMLATLLMGTNRQTHS